MEIKTTFVIGAGASKEANLPTGFELKRKISKLLDIRFDFSQQKSGDYQIANALRVLVQSPKGSGGDINPYLHEAWHISDALPQAISIDNFIDSHRGNEKIAICGKLAIVRSILEAEKNSILFFDKYDRNSGIKYARLEKTWYLPFFQLLTENCEKGDLEERFKSLAVIIFNYDRCLEHFLYYALQNYYQIADNKAAELLSHINFYHPYGSVGLLPWSNSVEVVEFGAELNAERLLEISNRIKTFTEGTDPRSSDIVSIKAHMRETDKLVFIGFAFHKLNMKLITPDDIEKSDRKPPKCYATTYGISESDKEVIQEQIFQLYSQDLYVRMASVECGKFFSEFWRSLAF